MTTAFVVVPLIYWVIRERPAAISWAMLAALSASPSVHWWHPYGRNQADGPGYSATGFPLPYQQPTGFSSLEYFVMPHIYAIDVALLAALAYFLIRIMSPVLRGVPEAVARTMGVVGAGFLVVVAALVAFGFSVTSWPVTSIAATGYYDSYLDYRPVFLVDESRDGSCYY